MGGHWLHVVMDVVLVISMMIMTVMLTHRVSAVGISTLSSYTSGNACEWLHMAVLSMATCALQAQQMPVYAVL